MSLLFQQLTRIREIGNDFPSQAICRAHGKYRAASFVFTRFLGFIADTRNDDEIVFEASW